MRCISQLTFFVSLLLACFNVVQIFTSLVLHCRTESAYSGLRDVRASDPQQDNSMQSFALAETFKYLYLLFSPSSVLPLSQYVFTTEAHPLRRFSSTEFIWPSSCIYVLEFLWSILERAVDWCLCCSLYIFLFLTSIVCKCERHACRLKVQHLMNRTFTTRCPPITNA
jgi:hypothetical protein